MRNEGVRHAHGWCAALQLQPDAPEASLLHNHPSSPPPPPFLGNGHVKESLMSLWLLLGQPGAASSSAFARACGPTPSAGVASLYGLAVCLGDSFLDRVCVLCRKDGHVPCAVPGSRHRRRTRRPPLRLPDAPALAWRAAVAAAAARAAPRRPQGHAKTTWTKNNLFL